MNAARALLVLPLLLAGCRDRGLEIYAAEFVDVWQQAPVRSVDVLLVVDSSGSMGGEQGKLAVEFQSFIQAFLAGAVDYHIGVITTDVADAGEAGLLRGLVEDPGDATPPPDVGEGPGVGLPGDDAPPAVILTPETPDAAAVFDRLVRVGTVGSGLEMGLEAARLALSEPRLSGHNSGFYRGDANLAVIIFSDEDDLSPLSVDGYLNFFSELKGGDVYRVAERFTLSAVVGDAPSGCEAADGDEVSIAYAGFRYIDAALRSDGVFRSICAEDFEPVVQALSLDISGLQDTFPLSYCARPETLAVTVGGVAVTQGVDYTYLPASRALQFAAEHLPAPGAEVRAAYGFWPDDRFECPEVTGGQR